MLEGTGWHATLEWIVIVPGPITQRITQEQSGECVNMRKQLTVLPEKVTCGNLSVPLRIGHGKSIHWSWWMIKNCAYQLHSLKALDVYIRL